MIMRWMRAFFWWMNDIGIRSPFFSRIRVDLDRQAIVGRERIDADARYERLREMLEETKAELAAALTRRRARGRARKRNK